MGGGFDNTALIALGATILAPDTEDRSTPYRLLSLWVSVFTGSTLFRFYGLFVFRFLTFGAGALFLAHLRSLVYRGASGVSALASSGQLNGSHMTALRHIDTLRAREER